jgi:hypothetical protein
MNTPVIVIASKTTPKGVNYKWMTTQPRHCEPLKGVWQSIFLPYLSIVRWIATSPSATRNDDLSCAFSDLRINFITLAKQSLDCHAPYEVSQ